MVICFYAFNGVRRQSAPEPKLIDWRITMRVVDTPRKNDTLNQYIDR